MCCGEKTESNFLDCSHVQPELSIATRHKWGFADGHLIIIAWPKKQKWKVGDDEIRNCDLEWGRE